MAAFLVLGFLLGLRHALEADHVAAVASLATRSPRLAHTVRLAVAWGVGHTLALVCFGAALLALEISLPEEAGRALESVVGVVLVLLGADVLRRWRRKNVHFHLHEHGGRRHFHAHAHEGEREHDPQRHEHQHASGLWRRALVVGGVHGLAGTAALAVLSLEALPSFTWAVIYLALFGFGSILGMVLLSLVISLPFRWSAAPLGRARGRLEAALGVLTILLGGWMALQGLL
jgi:ABC-type nickel/cobalt efflux system permease component RcnA